MDSESASIPEEYEDILLNEFAYDPIRLPPTEDRAQLLYNRRTLESIWDATNEAVNPFTRQPMDISNLIPQAELREEMHRYIANSPNLTLSLEVIPDYTKVLSEGEMRVFFSELKSAYQDLFIAEKEKRDLESEGHWKRLWQKFNLFRLYCQYRPENRVLLRSVGGYAYLALVAEGQFYVLFRDYTRCDDAKEILKEVGRIVDIIGLKESDLPPDLFMGIVKLVGCLATECDHLKTQGMVLRIYRRTFYDDFNIEKYLGFWLDRFINYEVDVTLYVLDRQNFEDIANEDLYNGMEILKAAWMKTQISCIESEFDFLGILVDIVTLCISRFHDLHIPTTVANEVEQRMTENDDEEAAKNEEEEADLHIATTVANEVEQRMTENDDEEAAKNEEEEADLHIATTVANEVEQRMTENDDEEAAKNDEEEAAKNEEEEAKKVHLISATLEGALLLINSILTATSDEEPQNEFFTPEKVFFSQSKEMLQETVIVSKILGMVELVMAGFKGVRSCHLQLGINIVAVLLNEEEDDETRNDVVGVFGDFLVSDIVDEYDSDVKLLLQEIVQSGNVSEWEVENYSESEAVSAGDCAEWECI